MWSLISRRWQIMLVVGAGVVLAWAGDALWVLLVGGHPTIIQTISLAAAIIGGVLTVAAELSWKWLWRRFPALQAKTFPDLSGKWEGTLLSTWVDPTTGQTKPPIPISIVINQGLFSTSVALRTKESSSYSTRFFLEPFSESGRFRIWYSYSNEPQAQFGYRSAPHEGVAFLELDYNLAPNRLTGRYYTARKTTGDLDVYRKHRGRR